MIKKQKRVLTMNEQKKHKNLIDDVSAYFPQQKFLYHIIFSSSIFNYRIMAFFIRILLRNFYFKQSLYKTHCLSLVLNSAYFFKLVVKFQILLL